MTNSRTPKSTQEPMDTSRRAIILAGAAILAGIVPSVHAATMDEIKKRGVINVATEDDYYPYEFIKDGKPDGFQSVM